MDSYRIIANKFPSDSLISNRQQFESEVQGMLQAELRKEGFIFQQLTSNLTAPQSLKDAIDAKNKATQEAYQAENKLRQAEAEAKLIEKERREAEEAALAAANEESSTEE